MATTPKSLSPFDIKGKGRIKTYSFLDIHSAVHTPPENLLPLTINWIMKEIETYCNTIQISIHDLFQHYHNANNALYMLPLNLCHLSCDQSPYETHVQPTISETDEVQQQDNASTTPSFFLRYSKVSLGNGLVSISTTCSLEGTYLNLTFCSSTCSLRK